MDVLFLCTGNSARSLMAEALLNAQGQGRVRAWSAGSQPRGAPHPLALEVIRTCGLETTHLRSKSWDEFASEDAPHMDVVITLCDSAAAEACPIWPGAPVKAHWGTLDPAAVEGSDTERLAAFAAAFTAIERRIQSLLSLPLDFLSPDELQDQLRNVP